MNSRNNWVEIEQVFCSEITSLLVSQVGGFTQVYEGDLTFATIREAGHQAPAYQPARAFSLIKHFLDGTPLPNTYY